MSNRLVRRFFKCSKCKDIDAQLVHPNKFQIKCSKCGSFLNEIQEKEYKIHKKTKKQNNEHRNNNDEPYRPSENAFRNISSVYNRPPSHASNRQNEHNNQNNNRIRFNNNNNNRQQQRNRRYQSTNHYTDMNIVNDNNGSSSNNNRNNNNDNSNTRSYNLPNSGIFRIIIHNPGNSMDNMNNLFNNNNNNNNNNNQNQNRININSSENENQQRETRNNFGQGARNRERSQDPTHSFYFNNFLNNFFGLAIPIASGNSNGQPFRIYVQRQNVPQNIFDPIFLTFGALFNNDFRDNFSSNFSSNFRGNFLAEIIRILERNQEEAARRAHPPATESAIKKLKRFPLTEKYCKKDKKGKIELPKCVICLSEIEKNEETVLLPCGHMFHWNCCLSWLKTHNTCPMCRFVIKD